MSTRDGASASEGREAEDVALKLLHTADWHLGRRFPSFPPQDQLTLMRARLEAVERIVECAERTGVDAVLCAGDLFDDPCPDPQWSEGLAQALRRGRPERPIVLLPGNHDPLQPGSVYEPGHRFRRSLPPHVHVVDRDDFTLPLGGEKAVVVAAPCRSRAGEKDLALALPARAPGDERIRIGLVHGATFDVPGHETNFPVARDAAARRALDYLALGDTHGFREVAPGGGPPTVYPGAPEPTAFDETEAGHVAIVFFPGGPGGRRRPYVQKQRVGRWRWREVPCPDMAALRGLRDGEDARHHVVRLVLDLAVSLAERDEVERILGELRGTEATHGRVGILLCDRAGLRLRPDAGPESFPETLPAPIREAAQRLERLAVEGEDAERPKAERALYHLYKLVREGA